MVSCAIPHTILYMFILSLKFNKIDRRFYKKYLQIIRLCQKHLKSFNMIGIYGVVYKMYLLFEHEKMTKFEMHEKK